MGSSFPIDDPNRYLYIPCPGMPPIVFEIEEEAEIDIMANISGDDPREMMVKYAHGRHLAYLSANREYDHDGVLSSLRKLLPMPDDARPVLGEILRVDCGMCGIVPSVYIEGAIGSSAMILERIQREFERGDGAIYHHAVTRHPHARMTSEDIYPVKKWGVLLSCPEEMAEAEDMVETKVIRENGAIVSLGTYHSLLPISCGNIGEVST